jgi:hypothetical protein
MQIHCYDPKQSEEENIRQFLLREIERVSQSITSPGNPFVYALALNHLILSSVFGLYFGAEPPSKIDRELARMQIDTILRLNEQFLLKEMTPDEFVEKLMTHMLPRSSFFLRIEKRS